jgi:hypothetical protein
MDMDLDYVAIIVSGTKVDGKYMCRGNARAVEAFINRALRLGICEPDIRAFKIAERLEFEVKLINE